jgi:hypothetical protein
MAPRRGRIRRPPSADTSRPAQNGVAIPIERGREDRSNKSTTDGHVSENCDLIPLALVTVIGKCERGRNEASAVLIAQGVGYACASVGPSALRTGVRTREDRCTLGCRSDSDGGFVSIRWPLVRSACALIPRMGHSRSACWWGRASTTPSRVVTPWSRCRIAPTMRNEVPREPWGVGMKRGRTQGCPSSVATTSGPLSLYGHVGVCYR